MRLPKMIMFDYGQTLVAEQRFDGVAGTTEVLKHATKNKYNMTPEQVQAHAEAINKELGRFDASNPMEIEIPNVMFIPYVYESVGIELDLTTKEYDKLFWDKASPGKPTEGIEDFLKFLKDKGIRTGVISNICYDPEVVAERINRLIPKNEFEFIIATSQYIYRKPNRRIFELGLEKADLKAEDVWYIGDNFKCDIEGALGAGMFPVWYVGASNINDTSVSNACTVKSWKELMELMEA